ncbi:MAG: hypothetical protein M2R45_01885 [Verrucomicrobia subdivision 3 bacterium]|nr:hypothetical protein [Limisphaerales bacterium]MCS1415685.1 hypothetical protein [Limisphaerales bacterium]
MKKKQFDLFLFSTVGTGICLVIVIGLNVIASFVKHRFDLTAEKLFTLSDGTRQILQEIDTPVDIRFYATRDDKIMPPQLKTYVRRVEDLLDEFRQNSGGNIEIMKFDPEPDSDAEDSARQDGVEGQAQSLTDRIYLGLAVSMLEETVAIPFLDPSKERQLEYEIARAISQVVTAEKTVIGVMSSLPAFGQPANPMMARMGQPQGQDPWVVINQLKQDFEVKEVEMTAESIDDDITVMIVIHPKDITEATEYALDQFVLRGGKLLGFLDALALIDQQPNPNNMMGSPPSTSNLPNLLKAWGIEFNSSKVVADMAFTKEVSFRQDTPPQLQPSVLFVNDNGINRDDIVTAQIDQLLLPFVGSFSGTPEEGLDQTVLLHTSKESQLVDGFMAQLSGQQIAKEFEAEDKELPIALRLTGKFKTAFPDGKPEAEETADSEDDIDKEDADEPEIDSLKESEESGTVILFADADFLFDSFSVRIQNFLGTRMISLRNGNLPLIQNIVEQLAGDNRLIQVRSRASMNRPFTTIRDMQIKAEEEYRSKIQALEGTLQQTQSKLNELQRQRTDVSQGQRFVLSPEQQAELKKFRKQQVDTNKQLKTMRRNLRKDINALETKLKWGNIAGMPLFITSVGILIATIKRKRTAAR